ncbi:TIGR01777 family oxidoreductase [Cellvibrio sp. PSBB023]|uniref:TIGR01777 family oxidoreductase n=1 Tax=Cellvibrio sp. PSBB023 TaxID=1945512 RepID=UPI00098F660D|nr:TIGR01777 family oxidoreductase [Cellvibrio sp. PSBB023]AQT59941.1 TIGR01777 family protein [Cellvibrio sp. PSBB023]
MASDSSAKERVLITGGSGFIGSALSHKLVHMGYEVWVLSRDPARAMLRLNKQVHVVRCLSDLVGIAFFAVINLVGESLGAGRWNEQSKRLFRQSRVDFTHELYGFFSSQRLFPQVLISASAIGVYGDAGSALLDEGAPVGDDFAAHLCRDWESAAQQFAAHSVRVCIVRIGIVLDSNGGALKQMLPAFRFGLGGRMGSGEQYMSWIVRQDLVQLFIFLLQNDKAIGVFNGVAPEPVTNRDFTALLAAQLGRPAFLPMPAFVLRLLFGEMADALLLSSQRVLPVRAEGEGFSFEYPRLQGALNKIFEK